MANRPPSSCTIGRRSGGITGTQSSTMPSGEFVVFRNDATTFSRLRARSFFCPLPVRIVSRRVCASASRSKFCSSVWSASAPMPPSKYSPNRSRSSRYSSSSLISCLTSSLRNVSSTSSSRSISRWARSRIWRISRSPPSRTLRRTSLLAPSASSSARSVSSFLARASISASRFFSSVDFSALTSASSVGRSRCRSSSFTAVIKYAAK